jgi:hypothetical protein
MSTEKSIYSIVVLGTMNPRIHSPAWYRLVGLISEEEMQEANQNELLIFPMVAKWQLKDLTMLCQFERWELQTDDQSVLPRVQDVAAQVFDRFLEHAVVGALGFNFNFERDTHRANAGHRLVSLLAIKNIGLKQDGIVSGEMALRRHINGRTVNVNVRVPDGHEAGSRVSVNSNYEYRFNSPTMQKLSLAETITSRFQNDLADADDQTRQIIQSFADSSE